VRDLHRHVHDLTDLLGEDLAERAAEDGEIVGEDERGPSVDLAIARDDAVAGHLLLFHPELARLVGPELVELREGSLVEEVVDPLAGGHLPLVVLLFDSRLATAPCGPLRGVLRVPRYDLPSS